jgi:hypothetical protein
MLSIGFYWMSDGASGREEFLATDEVANRDMDDREGMKEPAYIEVLVKDPDEGEMILHLPSVIEIRRTDLHEDSRYQKTAY